MPELRIETPKVFLPLIGPSRYKGAFGGRGSAKSHHFAEAAIERCIMRPGSRGVCIREVQKDLRESAKRLIEDKMISMGVGKLFRPMRGEIITPGNGIILFQGMQDHTTESIKSLENFDWAWVEEAQTLSKRSLEMLRPTIRARESEIWFSWNPRNAKDPVDEFFRGKNPPPDSACVRTNYMDNPFFPPELEMERAWDEVNRRERYGHIWLGEYEPQAIGAIWDRDTINNSRRSDTPDMERIIVAVDPAVSSEAGSDITGIIVAGKGVDGRGYVLDDQSIKGTPKEWAARAVASYDWYDADVIVAEINQGGDMVVSTIRSIRDTTNVKKVRATRGKHVRAEPIASLYQMGRISHIGTFSDLEDQMCLMTAAGYEGDGSPDRVDALVWAFTELFPSLISKPADPAKVNPLSRGRSSSNRQAWMGS